MRTVVCVRLWAPPCLPWELVGSMALNLVGGNIFPGDLACDNAYLHWGPFKILKIPYQQKMRGEPPSGSAEEMGGCALPWLG